MKEADPERRRQLDVDLYSKASPAESNLLRAMSLKATWLHEEERQAASALTVLHARGGAVVGATVSDGAQAKETAVAQRRLVV